MREILSLRLAFPGTGHAYAQLMSRFEMKREGIEN